MRASDFYTETVLPTLAERLDHAFPEFGWRRDARGWVATNEQHTHARLGVRAERVVAHGPAPRGFLVHGGEPMLWTAYVNGGTVPRGADFVRAVKEIAERAGVDPSPLDRPQPRDRRADLLQDFFDLCRRRARRRSAAPRRGAYLERRGFPRMRSTDSGLGLVPAPANDAPTARACWLPRGEIAKAGVLADSRWPGRLCGAWRDEYGRIGTLWARALDDVDCGRHPLPLSPRRKPDEPPAVRALDLLAGPRDARREIVLVEGFFDLHQLRARGIENVAALGGTSTRPQTFERLLRSGSTSSRSASTTTTPVAQPPRGPLSTRHEPGKPRGLRHRSRPPCAEPMIQMLSFASAVQRRGTS